MSHPVELPPRPKILVVALRRLGDVLLTTPLIRSLRRAWPEAAIDALVFADTAGILEGNPDLNGIIGMPPRPSHVQSLALAARLWRRYDLSISTQPGDRPTAFAIVAGRTRIAPVEPSLGGRIKSRFLHRRVPYGGGVHRVEQMLRLADALGIARAPELVNPKPRAAPGLPDGNYAVIHAAPMYRYKQWTKEGWRALAARLAERGLAVVATGGPAADERRYLDDVWGDGSPTVLRVDGRLGWPQLAGLLAEARVYVGPDTSVTHLAAASGCPTIALYGPTDPRLWGPWPREGLATMWDAAGTIQRRGNVWLVQNPLPCMPCQCEGCERSLGSYSACLDELAVEQVIAAVEKALEAFPLLTGTALPLK
jgi:heptosyltransferase III